MCSGSKAGSNLRRIDFVYHSTLGLRVIKREKMQPLFEALSITFTSKKPGLGYANGG